MAKVTLKMIAKESGLSYGAVSQVLSNPKHPRFSEITRKKILEAANRLDYRPNRFAAALKGQSVRLFSLVLPWNIPELMDSAESGARNAGFQLMVEFTPSPIAGTEEEAIATAIDWNVDGLIWLPYGNYNQYPGIIQNIRKSGMNVVLLSHGLAGLDGVSVVRPEMKQSTIMLVDHLAAQGYKKIVCITDQIEFGPDQKRLATIRKVSASSNISCQVLVISPKDFKKEMCQYLSSCDVPVATICNDTWFAIELIELAEELGIRCPENLGIVSIGDFSVGGRVRLGSVTRPRLTAIQEPLGIMAKEAVNMLVEMSKSDSETSACEKLYPEKLVIRESTVRKE